MDEISIKRNHRLVNFYIQINLENLNILVVCCKDSFKIGHGEFSEFFENQAAIENKSLCTWTSGHVLLDRKGCDP